MDISDKDVREIAVRLEGGAGDCLLANRFIPAIKEKYPLASVYAYIDSEGNTFQQEVLQVLYPSFYKTFHVIPSKKYKEFWVDCQFGCDNYKGALENIPDIWRKEMESYERFYDLHIDSLKWVDYDFSWLRYYKFFPKPELEPVETDIVMHLISSTSVGHRLEEWYIESLVNRVAKFGRVTIISTPETNHFYDCVKNNPCVEIFNGSIKEVCERIGGAKLMISTDSGFRYVAYGYGVPTLTFSKQSTKPFSSIPSHQIRWLMFPETCFPLNYDAKHIADISQRILNNYGYILAPYVNDFDAQLVRRRYEINQEKSILNE